MHGHRIQTAQSTVKQPLPALRAHRPASLCTPGIHVNGRRFARNCSADRRHEKPSA